MTDWRGIELESKHAINEGSLESSQIKEQTDLSASILGFYGAIKLAIKAGHNPDDVFKIVKDFLESQE